MVDMGNGFFIRALERAVFAVLTCIFALVGASIGTITGALTGHTTETGFLRGAGIGAIAGAVVSMEVLESLIDGKSFFSITIFNSLLNGKIFREWVSPAMLKAYQWQVSTSEGTISGESSDIFDIGGTKGLSVNFIKKLPKFYFRCSNKAKDLNEEKTTCAVCLQDFKEREHARRLPICRHFFHLICIDNWLVRHGSCPICRHDV